MRPGILLIALATALLPVVSSAQEALAPVPFQPVETPTDPGAIALYDGLAPGADESAPPEVWRDAGTERWATNVSHPTLLPFLPDDPTSTRAAVIIVPGGGFQFVSMDNEGYPIAEWLAERGIAAFVLKYRTMPTPQTPEAFAAHMAALWAPESGEPQIDYTPGISVAVADAQAALNLVKSRGDALGYDVDKIGMLGFSAGAITTLSASLSAEPDAPKPNFIGYIYGPMTAMDVPDGAPPMFAALAADDVLFAGQGLGLVEAWQSTGSPIEFHYYQNGGHGFGSYKRGVTADAWFDQFMAWMTTSGWLETTASESAEYAD